jgi:hypothetical protein
VKLNIFENLRHLRRRIPLSFLYTVLAALILTIFATSAAAHCDTMNGPVVNAARNALRTKNVNYVLIWVEKKDDVEVSTAFSQALKVRRLGPDARSLADKYFFETVVRLHRTNEDEPYTGIKPIGTEIEPIVMVLDSAIDTGSSTKLLSEIPGNSRAEIEQRFNELIKLKSFDINNVEAGRRYVKTYVTFIHYVEKLYEAADD